ncbi:MAG: L,D-transpeptidase family protein [Leptothrix sp. (in: b-proteobacteria)]
MWLPNHQALAATRNDHAPPVPAQAESAPRRAEDGRANRNADAQKRLQQGATLAEQQQLAEAAEVFTQLIHDYPDLTEAYNDLAVLQAQQGRYAEARSNFENALRTSQSHATAYDNLARLYALQASQAYAKALQQRSAASDSAPRFTMMNEISSSPWINPITPATGPVVVPAGDAASAASPQTAAPSWWSRLFSRTGAGPKIDRSGLASTDPELGLGTMISLMLAVLACITLLFTAVQTRAATRGAKDDARPSSSRSINSGAPAAPEARLIEIYRLIGATHSREALTKAESLVNEMPNFQLAQLVYGDLLMAQGSPIEGFGKGALALGGNAAATLSQLQQEAQKRLQALNVKPPAGTVPRSFLHLASTVRHAIAVDTLHSRLYLFENRPSGPVQIASYYVALGRLGTGKAREGDLRTPLGIYFVTGRLDTRELDDFYGAGALPLNYPNEHDRLHGRTGSDIWLHGVPSDQYARPPNSTNGCIVLANDDLRRLWRDLAPVHTPVAIARELDWVDPQSLGNLRKELLTALDNWRQARSAGDIQRTLGFYTPDFRLHDANATDSRRNVERDLLSTGPREREVRDVSLLAWTEEGERVVVNFTEHVRGNRNGVGRRQYWSREGGQWKIYSEGAVE